MLWNGAKWSKGFNLLGVGAENLILCTDWLLVGPVPAFLLSDRRRTNGEEVVDKGVYHSMPALGFVHTGSVFCERISPPVFFRAIAKAFCLTMASLFVSERAIALLACIWSKPIAPPLSPAFNCLSIAPAVNSCLPAFPSLPPTIRVAFRSCPKECCFVLLRGLLLSLPLSFQLTFLFFSILLEFEG